MLYYEISDEIIEQLYANLISTGKLDAAVTLEEFRDAVIDVLPPGHPDPCNKRAKDPE